MPLRTITLESVDIRDRDKGYRCASKCFRRGVTIDIFLEEFLLIESIAGLLEAVSQPRLENITRRVDIAVVLRTTGAFPRPYLKPVQSARPGTGITSRTGHSGKLRLNLDILATA
jgi:hypothetical protein